MPTYDVTVSCPIHDSFRVQQVAGMFDVPLAEKLRERFAVDVPALDEPWSIGLIVGPSGSGKSTLARHVFGERLYQTGDWPRDRAVIDGFGDAPIKAITGLLTAVGFWNNSSTLIASPDANWCNVRACGRAAGSRSMALIVRSSRPVRRQTSAMVSPCRAMTRRRLSPSRLRARSAKGPCLSAGMAAPFSLTNTEH
jgi:hypothetical protein